MAYNNRGIARVAKGDLTGARADFDEAIKVDPNGLPEAYVNRGLLLLQQGMNATPETVPAVHKELHLDDPY